MVREREFIVYGLNDLSIQRTMANGEAQAVMHVLIRNLGREGGRTYANRLKSDSCSLSAFAVEVPQLVTEGGLLVSLQDQRMLEPYAVSLELAHKDGSKDAGKYFAEAKRLLRARLRNL